jgi:hypothetical protein
MSDKNSNLRIANGDENSGLTESSARAGEAATRAAARSFIIEVGYIFSVIGGCLVDDD